MDLKTNMAWLENVKQKFEDLSKKADEAKKAKLEESKRETEALKMTVENEPDAGKEGQKIERLETSPILKENFELSKFEGEKKAPEKGVVRVVGGVDATPFKKTFVPTEDYRIACLGIQNALSIGLFDQATVAWIKKNGKAINKMATFSSLEELKDSWKELVGEIGKKEVFGASGVLNMLLAFLRCMSAYEPLKGLCKRERVTVSELNSLHINLPSVNSLSLVLGQSIQKKEERFVQVEGVRSGGGGTSELDETEEKETSELDETEQNETSELDETEQNGTSELDKTEQKETSELDETEQNETSELDETEQNETSELDETEQNGTSELDKLKEEEATGLDSTDAQKATGLDVTEERTASGTDEVATNKSVENDGVVLPIIGEQSDLSAKGLTDLDEPDLAQESEKDEIELKSETDLLEDELTKISEFNNEMLRKSGEFEREILMKTNEIQKMVPLVVADLNRIKLMDVSQASKNQMIQNSNLLGNFRRKIQELEDLSRQRLSGLQNEIATREAEIVGGDIQIGAEIQENINKTGVELQRLLERILSDYIRMDLKAFSEFFTNFEKQITELKADINKKLTDILIEKRKKLTELKASEGKKTGD